MIFAYDQIKRLQMEVDQLRQRLAAYEQPDDDEPVTVDWFRQEITDGIRNHLLLSVNGEWFLHCPADGSGVSVCCERHVFGHYYTVADFGRLLTTRGQVRRLIAALKGE